MSCVDTEVDDINGELELAWQFGYSSWIAGSVHDLSTVLPNTLVMCSGIHGVLYDYVKGEQRHLTGHSGQIGALTVSPDRTLIATAEAESSPDAMVIVWETRSTYPIANMQCPAGVSALAVSADNTAVAFLTHALENGEQTMTLTIWDFVKNTTTSANLKTENIFGGLSYNSRNPSELLCSSKNSVVFARAEDNLASISLVEVKNTIQGGEIVHSTFINNRNQVLSGTTIGSILVWRSQHIQTQRELIKSFPMASKSSITLLDNFDKWVIVATKDSAIRLFDYQFRVIFWFEDIRYGAINSLSFDFDLSKNQPDPFGEKNRPPEEMLPEFIFSTASGSIVKMTRQAITAPPKTGVNRGFLLVQGFDSHLTCIAGHPKCKTFAVGTELGTVQIMDFANKTILSTKKFESSVLALCYSPTIASDNLLALTLRNGQVHIVNGSTYNPNASFKFEANESMHTLAFSPNGKFLAMGSSSGRDPTAERVYLFAFHDESSEWEFIGRNQSHSLSIICVVFQKKTGALFSLGKDGILVEYDLPQATFANGLRVKSVTVVEQRAVPTALWFDPVSNHVIISNSELKIRTFVNAPPGSWTCVRTIIGPHDDSNGPIDSFSSVCDGNGSPAMVVAYKTRSKMLGLAEYPFAFNKHIGIVGHASSTEIISLVISFDGQMLLTCGARDQCVNIWKFDLKLFERTMQDLKNASFSQDELAQVKDVISYCQLQEGIESTANSIDIRQIGNALCALGCFLSEHELHEIGVEIVFMKTGAVQIVPDKQRELCPTISLEEFLKVFINHRPTSEVDVSSLSEAFRLLGADADSSIHSRKLVDALSSYGERMPYSEFVSSIKMLNPGDPSEIECNEVSIISVLPEKLSPETLLDLLSIDRNDNGQQNESFRQRGDATHSNPPA